MNHSEERVYFFLLHVEDVSANCCHSDLLVLYTTACLLVGIFSLQYFQSN